MNGESYSLELLRDACAEKQIQIMEAWFRDRFEDPAHRTPYESAAGGYIWIWGGPHDAWEELSNEFQGVVPGEVIEQLASSLVGECHEWAPTEQPGDYDQDLFNAITQNRFAQQTLDDALSAIASLLVAEVPDWVGEIHCRLLFANAITALETFLSDTFINRVFANKTLIQTYIDFEPKFSERKVPLRDVWRTGERVSDEAKKELLDLIWHNLGKVKTMYAKVLLIDLGDIDALAAAVRTRHDIVHRNGRRKDGTLISVDKATVRELLSQISLLAARVNLALNPVPPLEDAEDREAVF